MTPPILLIAEREFRTYVATLSFWLSLALAPLVAGTVLLFSHGVQPPAHIGIEGGGGQIAQSATQALEEAGRLEGRHFVFGPGGANLIFSRRGPDELDMAFSAGFPLSPTGRAMVGHLIERDAARETARKAALAVRDSSLDAPTGVDTGMLSRLAAMLMLWLTLTGSLGMLLQAVVRERANRALESLLAAAEGWEIVAGKMLGVGAVSLLVLSVWGGTAALLPLLAGHSAALSAIAGGFSQPAMLLHNAAIYVCAYIFYGAITLALGAVARDSASAQNAARPMFVLLLAGFFIAMFAAGRQEASWLILLPPFTPFLLLVLPPAALAPGAQIGLLALLLAISAMTISLAARLLYSRTGDPYLRGLFSGTPSNSSKFRIAP